MKGRIAIKLACILTAALAVSAGIQAHGQGQGFGRHMPPMERAMGPMGNHGQWWNDPAVIDKLKLTDQQRKDMDAILQDHREKLIDLRANVEKAEVAMQPMIQADQPNEAAILAQIDKIAQARAELEKGNARFLLALRAKLTPDQWKALQDLRAARRDHRDQRMWRRNGPGAGPGPGGSAPAPPPPAPPQQ
ncbi:MAG: Spy/CpxP family protein refolding chaperone [Acidobacteriota bacterium]